MAIRSNHYDVAFEEYLRARCVPYVAVDEKRRALLADSSIKSFDFIVEADGPNLLVDVKGRLWGASQNVLRGGRRGSSRKWENWATEDDIASLLKWEQVFGESFRAMLVFAYAVEAPTPIPSADERDDATLFKHNGRTYFFASMSVRDYACYMKPRSAGWNTVTVPAADYRANRQPLETLLSSSPAA